MSTAKKNDSVKFDRIILIRPYKGSKKDMRKALQFVTHIHHMTYNVANENIELIIDYLEKYINAPEVYSGVLGQTIKFYVSEKHRKSGVYYELPLVEFLYALIMLAPLIDMEIELTQEDIFNPNVATTPAIIGWIDNMIMKHRDKCTYYDMCQYVVDIMHNFDKLIYKTGYKLAMSLDIGDFITMMKRSETAREIITVSNVPDKMEPWDLEKLSWDRINTLSNEMSREKDLNSSIFVNTKLFNIGQFKEFASHITYKPDADGHTIDVTENTNLLMGIGGKYAQYVDANGGRKAEILKIAVADAGTFEFNVSVLLSDVINVDTEYDCGSTHLRRKHIHSTSDLNHVIGRAYALTPDSKKFNIVKPDSTHLIGKTIYMKTVITCTHPHRETHGTICRGCYGEQLAIVNQHTHIGRITAFDITEKFQQDLLSAKHENTTDTFKIMFSENFDTFFKTEGTFITFNTDVGSAVESTDLLETYRELWIEFNQLTVDKTKDGEGRRMDRQIPDIVIYDSRTDERIIITESTGSPIYMSPAMSELYIAALRAPDICAECSDIVRIPMMLLLEEFGSSVPVFEAPYSNKELNAVLRKAMKLIETKEIEKYTTYDDLCDEICILYEQSNLGVADVHVEMLISRLVGGPNNESYADWSDPFCKYKFRSIEKSIRLKPSALTSLVHSGAATQLKSDALYEKTAAGPYDAYLADI